MKRSEVIQLMGVPVYYWCLNCQTMFKLRFSKYTPGVTRCSDCGMTHEFHPKQVERLRKENEADS